MDAARLVEDFRHGDFLLATDTSTLLASGIGAEIVDTDEDALTDRVTRILRDRDHRGPSTDDEADIRTAVGVLPFDAASSTPARMVVPATLRSAGPPHPGAGRLERLDVPTPSAIRAVPSEDAHMSAVATAVTELAVRDLRKVVLARALDVEFTEPVPTEAIAGNLVRDNRHGYVFAAGLPGERVLVGASPELLVSRHGRQVVSHPHAGSMPRSADPEVDAANARRLLSSKKDRVEHAVLTEAVAETLRPFCSRLDVPDEPRLERTPTMWHLGTRITGELADPDVTALRLAAALHPTPAICGTPTSSARELVRELEPFDRGYYAGTVGWVNADGDGEWAVSIRCADTGAKHLRMYAGGGIVPDSDPRAELDETSAKFATLARAMGFDTSE
ncbi:isochorismate synthase [Streptomyces regensis]|nr:isochorismate synthase [Streptomyces regensis]